MKFVFRWAFRLTVLAIVLVVCMLLLKDLILREWVQYRARAATGLDIRIGSFSVSLLEPMVSIKDLTIFNPPEFGGGPLISLPEVHVEYDRERLSSRRLRLRLLRVNLAEMTVVQDAAGKSNLEAIGAPLRTQTNQATARGAIAFDGIDTLNLTVGAVNYINLGAPERNRTYHLRLRNEVVTNLRTPFDVYLAFARLAFKATMGALAPPGLPPSWLPGLPGFTNLPGPPRPPGTR